MCAWKTMIVLEYGREIIVGIVVNKLNIEINKSVAWEMKFTRNYMTTHGCQFL